MRHLVDREKPSEITVFYPILTIFLILVISFYSSLMEVMDTAEGKFIGKVLHVYRKISVVVLRPSDTLKVGDTIRVAGKAGIDFTQKVESIEIDHKKIQEARPGDDIGLKVNEEVREGCSVFKI